MIPLLRGIRILELSTVVMGPMAGQMLGDLGAEVIKLEPIEGDIARSSDQGALFVNNNRNKRVICVDLKTAPGQTIVRQLIARAHGLLINMRPEAAQRLQVGFEQATQVNSDLIYCALIGFGERGPYRGRPAFDDVIQAAAALAGIGKAQDEPPRFVPTVLADKVAALYATCAFLGALTAKSRGRKGSLYVEVPMFEALASFVLNEHLSQATFREDGEVGYSRVLSKDRRPFQTQDGWIAVLPYTGQQWRRFLTEMARHDLMAQSWFDTAEGRLAHIDELYAAIAASLRDRTTAAWCEVLARLDIPFSRVATLDDLLTDPHLSAIGFFDPGPHYPPDIKRKLAQPAEFRGIEAIHDQPPRRLGADTREILHELGYEDSAIDAMIAKEEILA